MVTFAVPLMLFEQAPFETEIKVNDCADVAFGTVTVAVPETPIVAVAVEPLLIEYDTISDAVPVMVNVAVAPKQIAADPAATVADKAAGTVMVTELELNEHKFASETFKEYVPAVKLVIVPGVV